MQPATTTEDKMAKHGKKYKAALAKVDLNKEYSSRSVSKAVLELSSRISPLT